MLLSCPRFGGWHASSSGLQDGLLSLCILVSWSSPVSIFSWIRRVPISTYLIFPPFSSQSQRFTRVVKYISLHDRSLFTCQVNDADHLTVQSRSPGRRTKSGGCVVPSGQSHRKPSRSRCSQPALGGVLELEAPGASEASDEVAPEPPQSTEAILLHLSLTAYWTSGQSKTRWMTLAQYWLASWLLHRDKLPIGVDLLRWSILMILFETFVSSTFSSRSSPTTFVLICFTCLSNPAFVNIFLTSSWKSALASLIP